MLRSRFEAIHDPGRIVDELCAELAPAAISHHEHSAMPLNNSGDELLVRRVSGEAGGELPKREPLVVFNKNLEDLVEHPIWIEHQVYSTLLLGNRVKI